MALPDELSADLAELEMEISPDGVTAHQFTWNSGTYNCVPGSTTRGKTLGSGGFGLEGDLALFVRDDLFGDGPRPASKQKLTFSDREWQITDVVVPAGNPFLKLVCIDPNRNLATR